MLPVQDNQTYVTFVFVGVKAKTEKAVQVVLDDGSYIWLPKSQIVCNYGDGVNHFGVIPYWLADQNGLMNKTWSGHLVHDVEVRTGAEFKQYMKAHGVDL